MITVVHPGAANPSHVDRRLLLGRKTRDVLLFVAIWAGVLLLAIAVEVGGLYLLDALR